MFIVEETPLIDRTNQKDSLSKTWYSYITLLFLFAELPFNLLFLYYFLAKESGLLLNLRHLVRGELITKPISNSCF